MWPTWWWPQALMQPEMLIFSGPISCWRSMSAKRRDKACATGIERAVASEQYERAAKIRDEMKALGDAESTSGPEQAGEPRP